FSFTLVSPKEVKQARAIEQLIKREIQWVGEAALATAEVSDAAEEERPKRRSRGKAKVDAKLETRTEAKTEAKTEVSEASPARARGKPEPVQMSAESVEETESRAEVQPRKAAPR